MSDDPKEILVRKYLGEETFDRWRRFDLLPSDVVTDVAFMIIKMLDDPPRLDDPTVDAVRKYFGMPSPTLRAAVFNEEMRRTNENKIKDFVSVINDLVDLEGSAYSNQSLHVQRRLLWGSMTEAERHLAKLILGERAKWC